MRDAGGPDPREPVRLIVIGAGGHGSEVLAYVRDLARAGEPVVVQGFVDEDKTPGPWKGTEIVGGFPELEALLEQRAGDCLRYITAVGDNRARESCVQKAGRVKTASFEPWTLVHPRAILGPDVCIGPGACLAPGCVLTTSVQIGRHCIVNVGVSISHDSIVGDYVNVNPGAVIAGGVRLGTGAYIGAGATVIENVSVGEWTTVGAGAVVLHDLPPHVTAVGVPARVIRTRS